MEVKDPTYNARGLAIAGKQTSSKSLPRVTPLPLQSGQAVAQDSESVSFKKVSNSRIALNQAKDLATEISERAGNINSYVKSLGGIISQGLQEKSEVRRNALSKEARQVLQAIKEKVVSISSSSASNISADPIRSEVEAKIGRTLDILFRDEDEKDPEKGLSDISFSNKELIISIQTKILKTSQYLESLKKEDALNERAVKETLDKAEIAQANVESSQASVRDLDTAFELVKQTSRNISDYSETALFAIGNLKEYLDIRE